MDAQAISRVFRTLFSHQTCSRIRYYPSVSQSSPCQTYERRYYRSSREERQLRENKSMSNWQQRIYSFPPDKLKDYEQAPMVTSGVLRSRRERPRNVKMLTRDFIEGLIFFSH